MTAFPLDFRSLTLRRRPNRFLMLPDGFEGAAEAHAVSPVFGVAPAKLLDAARRVFSGQPRTALVHEDQTAGQIELVQRSALFRFPDRITVEAVAAGKGKSALAIYSRSKLGYRDFGVNAARVTAWLKLLETGLAAGKG